MSHFNIALMETDDLIVQKIRGILDKNNIAYKYLEHEPTPTSEDAARVRGTKLEQGAKAMILKASKSNANFMVVLPGNLKLDVKKIRTYVGEEIIFESPDVIFEKYGLAIGGVPPFGNILGIEVLIDIKLFDNDEISFNCGKKTSSIIMKSSDYRKIVGGIEGNWTK